MPLYPLLSPKLSTSSHQISDFTLTSLLPSIQHKATNIRLPTRVCPQTRDLEILAIPLDLVAMPGLAPRLRALLPTLPVAPLHLAPLILQAPASFRTLRSRIQGLQTLAGRASRLCKQTQTSSSVSSPTTSWTHGSRDVSLVWPVVSIQD